MDPHDHSVDDEMHELNQEADFLDQKTVVDPHSPPHVNGHNSSPSPMTPKSVNRHSDPDAQALVIDSLRSQIQDLFSQVSQLNSKLVKSYDRVSDLEDELHITSSNLRQSSLKIGHLEMERTQHLSALSTGLLVERSHVTTELTRLMEKATEEAARAGEAESAKAAIEKDLDDLSAGLFDQANTMVAEARLARARSERKVVDTEQALKGAEEVVAALQAQMQSLEAEKEHAERKVEDMRVTMGKGKWAARSPDRSEIPKLKLLASHSPYMEFLLFISHLRTIRPSSPQVPAMSSLLPLPFLARLVSEDSDPTVRLDLAPSLNWLTRRSVLSAIHSGQLEIEPMATMTLLEELAPPMIPGNTHNTHIACALCGASVLDQQSAPLRPPPSPTTSAMSRYGTNGSWSTALKNSLPTNFSSRFTTHNNHSSSSFTFEPPTQVYIFRLAATSSSGLPMSLPLGAQQPNGATRPATIYPLCHSGWCLGRLRTTCSLWAFIRTSVVEKVWEEVAIAPPPLPAREVPHSLSVGVNGSNGKTEGTASPGEQKTTDVNQAISPKKSRIGIGSLWGTMSRGLGSTKAPEPEKETEVEKKPVAQGKASVKSPVTSPRRLPPPPPVHPSRTDNHLPPPPQAGAGGAPPPLPKRNRTRPDQAPKRASVSPPNGTDHAEQEERVSEEGRPSTPSLSTTTPPTNGPSSTESQDHFTTPTEELPPSTPGTPTPKPKHASRSVSPSPSPPTPAPVPIPERPMSPHKIPLPTSRPSTPVRVPRTPPPHSPGFSKLSGNEKRRSMSPVKIPSRSGSPAPGAAHISNGGTSSIPGTPPPIPRRAAARTRPVSSSGLASTAGVVLPPPTEPVAEEKKDELEEKTTEAPNEQAPRESEESQEPTMDTQETVENNSDEKLAPVELPPPDEKAELGESAEKTESGDEASPPAYEPSSADGPQPELADKKAPEDPFTTTVDTATSPVIEDPNGGLVTEPENDLGIYVGDSTWEERTFKEVVRLREEMFWARVGGLR